MISGAFAAALLLGPGMALAQDKGAPAAAPAWNTQTSAQTDSEGITLEPRQIEIVKLVSGYFNGIENLKGNFVQTSPDKKRLRGKVFMKKPGRIRFEYAAPSRQLIISDGKQIAIQDLDINTDDRVMVDQTPFRMLLKKDVDLLRDARILEVQEDADLVILTVQDKSKDATGKVRLFLQSTPVVELKEWVTTDAQGLDTRLEVSNLDKSTTVDAELFKITSPQLKNLQ